MDLNHATPAVDAESDVLVIGAGPAGLSLACALADAGITVTLLEQQPRAALDAPAEDGREIALTHRARRIMETLGLWQQLPPDEVAPLREARVLDGDDPSPLRFAAPPTGPAAGEPLGWLVPNHQIRRAALAAALARPNVRLLCDAQVQALSLSDERAEVRLADGRRLAAPLVVAADSRLSRTRALAGIGAAMRDFGRGVIVARMAHTRGNEGIAWECFRHGNTLALLPMNGDQASAVVTLPGDQVPQWMALSDAEFAARIEAQSGGRLGALRLVAPRHHYPLIGVYAQRFVARRFALVGDAAVGMHPVTAHGFNFGLYGAEVLAAELKAARSAGRDLGDAAALQAYERIHRRTTLPVYLGTNAVVSLFTDDRGPARLARRAVLALAERAPGIGPLVKAAVTRQLTGDGSRFGFPPPPWRRAPPAPTVPAKPAGG